MSTKLQNAVRAIVSIPQQAFRYVSDAIMRIFSPSEDNYPETGVQPYEGDPADKESL